MKIHTIEENSKNLLQQLSTLSAAELERLVYLHNRLYFEENSPQISDDAFDKLLAALRLANPQSAALSQVGSLSALRMTQDSIVHQQKMLSLDKCYDDLSFARWHEKIKGDIIAMPKIDGVACSIRYDSSGKLSLAATRGDGSIGENVTQNVLQIKDVPSDISAKMPKNYPLGLEVRGEVYLSLSRFKEKYAQDFANPRNLAAGALKQKSAEKSAEYGLSFFPYDIKDSGCVTEAEKFSLLSKLGFIIPEIQELSKSDVQSIFQHFFAARDKLNYEIDGVVFRANEVQEQERLGHTAHHPRYAIAYKFQGESAQTMVRDIVWSVGRTGTITPVCIVEPVFVSGATVSRASLHNVRIFKSHDIRESTLVEIVRRGGVIPYVERVLRSSGKAYPLIDSCPSCQGPVREVGDFIYCQKPDICPNVILARVAHFVSVVDIQGFGTKILEQLINAGLVKRSADLYRLTQADLLGLERLAEKSSAKLIKEIQLKKNLELATFITAIGFDEVGPTVAIIIAEHFKTIEAILQLRAEDLASLPGIGPSISQSFVDGMAYFHDDILALLEQINVKNEAEHKFDDSHPFYEKNIVFTGSLEKIDRKEAQKKVRAVGGKTPSSISANTDFLVAGDEGDGKKESSKMKTVKKLNATGASIQILSEEDFLKLLG